MPRSWDLRHHVAESQRQPWLNQKRGQCLGVALVWKENWIRFCVKLISFKHFSSANLGVCQTLASLPGAATPGRAATHLCRRARSCEGRGSNEISWNVFMWSYFARLHFVFFSFDLMPELASLLARGTRPQPAVLPPATPPEQPIISYNKDVWGHIT